MPRRYEWTPSIYPTNAQTTAVNQDDRRWWDITRTLPHDPSYQQTPSRVTREYRYHAASDTQYNVYYRDGQPYELVYHDPQERLRIIHIRLMGHEDIDVYFDRLMGTRRESQMMGFVGPEPEDL